MANTRHATASMDAACLFFSSVHPFVHHLLEAAKEMMDELLGKDRAVVAAYAEWLLSWKLMYK